MVANGSSFGFSNDPGFNGFNMLQYSNVSLMVSPVAECMVTWAGCNSSTPHLGQAPSSCTRDRP